MEVIFNFLNQGWVGATIGIIGLVIAIYTVQKTKIGPRLVYQMNSLEIIGRNEVTPDEITIFYKGIKVPRVIKTTLIIWNSGTKTIDGENIVKSDPLRLEFGENEEIIGASVLKSTKKVNHFVIQNNEDKRNILNIDFEYLDQNDGVIIEVLHTDVKRYPDFKGTIKGIPNGAINWGIKSNTSSKYSLSRTSTKSVTSKMLGIKLFSYSMIVAGICFILFSVLVPVYFQEYANEFNSSDEKDVSRFTTFFVIGLLYITLPILNIWISRRRYPKKLNID